MTLYDLTNVLSSSTKSNDLCKKTVWQYGCCVTYKRY